MKCGDYGSSENTMYFAIAADKKCNQKDEENRSIRDYLFRFGMQPGLLRGRTLYDQAKGHF